MTSHHTRDKQATVAPDGHCRHDDWAHSNKCGKWCASRPMLSLIRWRAICGRRGESGMAEEEGGRGSLKCGSGRVTLLGGSIECWSGGGGGIMLRGGRLIDVLSKSGEFITHGVEHRCGGSEGRKHRHWIPGVATGARNQFNPSQTPTPIGEIKPTWSGEVGRKKRGGINRGGELINDCNVASLIATKTLFVINLTINTLNCLSIKC